MYETIDPVTRINVFRKKQRRKENSIYKNVKNWIINKINLYNNLRGNGAIFFESNNGEYLAVVAIKNGKPIHFEIQDKDSTINEIYKFHSIYVNKFGYNKIYKIKEHKEN